MSKKRKRSRIVETRAAVARHFGVAERTVGNWISRGMPGSPGRYDTERIAAWREGLDSATKADRDKPVSDRQRLDRIRADREALRLARERHQLVPLEAVRRLFIRHVDEAKAILMQIPDAVIGALPAKTTTKDRQNIGRDARRIVEDTCQALSDLLTAPEIAAAPKE